MFHGWQASSAVHFPSAGYIGLVKNTNGKREKDFGVQAFMLTPCTQVKLKSKIPPTAVVVDPASAGLYTLDWIPPLVRGALPDGSPSPRTADVAG